MKRQPIAVSVSFDSIGEVTAARVAIESERDRLQRQADAAESRRYSGRAVQVGRATRRYETIANLQRAADSLRAAEREFGDRIARRLQRPNETAARETVANDPTMTPADAGRLIADAIAADDAANVAAEGVNEE